MSSHVRARTRTHTSYRIPCMSSFIQHAGVQARDEVVVRRYCMRIPIVSEHVWDEVPFSGAAWDLFTDLWVLIVNVLHAEEPCASRISDLVPMCVCE